jgi:excisionase family DNA binding protein
VTMAERDQTSSSTLNTGRFVSVSEAAHLTNRSSRQILRLIKNGKIRSKLDSADRRVRLVQLVDVVAAISSDWNSSRGAGSSDPSGQPSEVLESGDKEDDFQDRDQALGAAYSQYENLCHNLGIDPVERSAEELSRSPLAHKLNHLAAVGDGTRIDRPERVRILIDDVLRSLFWSPGLTQSPTPRGFWVSQLGQELAGAWMRSIGRSNLVGVAEAARRLACPSSRIYRMIDEGTLFSIRDPESGQVLVSRSEIETMLKLRNANA